MDRRKIQIKIVSKKCDLTHRGRGHVSKPASGNQRFNLIVVFSEVSGHFVSPINVHHDKRVDRTFTQVYVVT